MSEYKKPQEFWVGIFADGSRYAYGYAGAAIKAGAIEEVYVREVLTPDPRDEEILRLREALEESKKAIMIWCEYFKAVKRKEYTRGIGSYELVCECRFLLALQEIDKALSPIANTLKKEESRGEITDSQRLDWIESKGCGVSKVIDGFVIGINGQWGTVSKTVRACIDAAIRGEG